MPPELFGATLTFSGHPTPQSSYKKLKGLAPHAADLAVSTRFDTKNGSWGIPVVTAGLASQFRAVLTRLC